MKVHLALQSHQTTWKPKVYHKRKNKRMWMQSVPLLAITKLPPDNLANTCRPETHAAMNSQQTNHQMGICQLIHVENWSTSSLGSLTLSFLSHLWGLMLPTSTINKLVSKCTFYLCNRSSPQECVVSHHILSGFETPDTGWLMGQITEILSHKVYTIQDVRFALPHEFTANPPGQANSLRPAMICLLRALDNKQKGHFHPDDKWVRSGVVSPARCPDQEGEHPSQFNNPRRVVQFLRNITYTCLLLENCNRVFLHNMAHLDAGNISIILGLYQSLQLSTVTTVPSAWLPSAVTSRVDAVPPQCNLSDLNPFAMAMDKWVRNDPTYCHITRSAYMLNCCGLEHLHKVNHHILQLEELRAGGVI
ncbi:hypothetical protein AAFF_G00327130 [Aldrovandia affinis]|uniref:Uncharacterized protein n=1 Tax=Aldrovandia affinis TaxID=143900 RepID=A0AAD7X1H5_9TELE|nr:hypothetical protein AAFF_G00327130 [Aldrovandia affinis]